MSEPAAALETYRDHQRQPRSMGRMAEPDGIGNIGSIVVGRALRFFVELDGERVAQARFQVFACPDAVPAASRLCELVVGMAVDEAAALGVPELRAAFGGLDADELPVVPWALHALRLALAAARGEAPPLAEDRLIPDLVCRCHGITRTTIEETIAELGAPEVEDLVEATGAGSGCGTCRRDLAALVETSAESAAPAPSTGGKGRVALLKRIDEVAAPLLAEVGGALQLWNLEGATVILRASGDPADHAGAVTRVEMTLRDEVDPTLSVRLEQVP